MTPLWGVLGGLELIEKEADKVSPQELKEILGLIRKSAERQQKLSGKLVRFFELERMMDRKDGAGTAKCQVHEAITVGAGQAAAEMGRQADVHVKSEPAQVPLAGPILIDAVAELVGNALRFAAAGEPVSVTGRRQGSGYVIEVVDRGPGMTPEQRSAVGAFTQFERERKEQQGLGLGLAIVQTSATLAGGRLVLGDGPGGRGLSAAIELPSCD